MELWATDTHCKHQSGMGKTQVPPQSHHPTTNKVGELDFAEKQEVDGKMGRQEGRENR